MELKRQERKVNRKGEKGKQEESKINTKQKKEKGSKEGKGKK